MAQRILLVEDDDTLRSLLQAILERSGFRVVPTPSIARASVEILRAPTDLIVLDEVLPDGSGLEFVIDCREQGWLGPVILVTGFDVDLDQGSRPAAAHISAVLRKPVAGRDLVAAVNKTLSQPSQGLGLDATRQQTRSGFATQLGARIARLAVEIERLRRGGTKPRAAQRYARKIRREATEQGFPKLVRVLTRIESELTDLHLDAPIAAAEDHRRLGLLLDQAQRAVPSDNERNHAKLPQTRGIIVVQPDAQRAVRLIAEGNRQGLPITVVPHEAEAARVSIMEPILGVLFCRITSEVEPTARRIRDNCGNPNLLVAAIPEGSDGDIASVLDAVPGTVILSKTLSDEAMVVSLIDALRRPGRAHLRAMVVDDDEVLGSTISDILGTYGVDVISLTDPSSLTSQINAVDPDVVLLGAHDKDGSGFDLCRILRANPRWRDLPLIFVTSGHDRTIRARCYEVGGSDFLEQPILPQEMWARIQSHVATARVRTAAYRRDPVTGLGARQTLIPVLRHVFELREDPAAIGLIGISDLASINHGRGFEAGDVALRALGRAVAQLRMPGLASGRWSSSSLLVIMPQMNLPMARMLLSDITDRFAVEELRPVDSAPFVAECRSTAMLSSDTDTLHGLLALLETRLKGES
jgi:DNA-binding response OmpR family regulator